MVNLIKPNSINVKPVLITCYMYYFLIPAYNLSFVSISMYLFRYRFIVIQNGLH